jgi:hypothetical protein
MVAIRRNPNNPWKVIDYYDGGGAKTYRHDATGETLSRAQYRRLKENGFSETDAFEEAPELDASPDVEIPKPPPQRDWQTFGELGGKVEAATSSLWSKIAPGLYSVVRGGSKLVLTRMDREYLADYFPPGEIVQPILKPATRILDRHMPLRIAAQGSEDLVDILAMIAATDKLIDYLTAVTARHQEAERAYYEQYGDQEEGDQGQGQERPDAPRTGASDRTPSGRERKPATGARTALERYNTWRDATRQDTGDVAGERRSDSRNGRGLPGDDVTDNDPGVANVADDKTARSAASIAWLREQDARGRLQKGLG